MVGSLGHQQRNNENMVVLTACVACGINVKHVNRCQERTDVDARSVHIGIDVGGAVHSLSKP